METKEITYHVKFIAEGDEGNGYMLYVFERLEYDNLDDKYIMCVKFPNWHYLSFKLGDIGYVSVRYVEEGKDKWFDGTDFIPFKNSHIIFLKFVHDKVILVDNKMIID